MCCKNRLKKESKMYPKPAVSFFISCTYYIFLYHMMKKMFLYTLFLCF